MTPRIRVRRRQGGEGGGWNAQKRQTLKKWGWGFHLSWSRHPLRPGKERKVEGCVSIFKFAVHIQRGELEEIGMGGCLTREHVRRVGSVRHHGLQGRKGGVVSNIWKEKSVVSCEAKPRFIQKQMRMQACMLRPGTRPPSCHVQDVHRAHGHGFKILEDPSCSPPLHPHHHSEAFGLSSTTTCTLLY